MTKKLKRKVSLAYSWYRGWIVGVLRRLHSLPLPIKLDVALIVIPLPLGFYLNEQDSNQLNYLADQMSGFVALGVGLIIAYTLIDKFNEKAEEAKYGRVRALTLHYLNHELSLFLIETVGALYQNNLNEQARRRLEGSVGSLGWVYGNDFSNGRRARLEALAHETHELAERMLGRSGLTRTQVNEYLPSFEKRVEKISGSLIPRLVEARLNTTVHAALMEADTDLKLSRQTLEGVGMMAPEEMENPELLKQDEIDDINEASTRMAEVALIAITNTLLNLFFYTSHEVERGDFLREMQKESEELFEPHLDSRKDPLI